MEKNAGFKLGRASLKVKGREPCGSRPEHLRGVLLPLLLGSVSAGPNPLELIGSQAELVGREVILLDRISDYFEDLAKPIA